jgi:anti-sigma factor RsiW
MSDPAPGCDKVLLVQAELDGELDAAEAAALAFHRAGCPVCRQAAAELARARALIGDELNHRLPQAARARLLARLSAAAAPGRPPAGRRRDWLRPLAGFGLGAACAAVLSLLLIAPRQPDLAEQVVYGHIRALQPGHLEDVVSTDRHTVKPWFDGRIGFAPPVKDLAAERFPLRGGRLDYLAGRPVAALVYQRDKHIIDLFIWPVEAAVHSPVFVQYRGYNVVRWVENGMSLWAVSDLEAGQLREFAEAWRGSP